jgi:hypothetical protein
MAMWGGLWARSAALRYRITVERSSITSTHWPLGGTVSIAGRDTQIEVLDDPLRVAVIDDAGREHVLATGITEKQAHVLKARILRALKPEAHQS